MKCSLFKKNQGLTLIELLISLAILAIISFSIYHTITQTFRLRNRLLLENEFHTTLCFAIRCLQKDIALLYSPIPFFCPSHHLPAFLEKGFGLQNAPFWGEALDETKMRPARFVGTKNRLLFITTSHLRIYSENLESEFAQVIYEVKDLGPPKNETLLKIENPNAFELYPSQDLPQTQSELLTNIKNLNFTYLLQKGNTWKESPTWDNSALGTLNCFPDLIKMEIELKSPKNIHFKGEFKFTYEIPLVELSPYF